MVATAAAFAICAERAAAEEKTVGEKSAEVWDKTKAKTKEVSRTVVKETKEAVAKAEAAIDKPDADARRVEVTVTDKGVQVPKSLSSGKTAFAVKNSGKKEHNFEIKGEALEKSFWFDVEPGQTKIMQVNLKAGSYEARCSVRGHEKEATTKVTAK